MSRIVQSHPLHRTCGCAGYCAPRIHFRFRSNSSELPELLLSLRSYPAVTLRPSAIPQAAARLYDPSPLCHGLTGTSKLWLKFDPRRASPLFARTAAAPAARAG